MGREAQRRSLDTPEMFGRSIPPHLGDGTILAARWKHRISTDIDVLLPGRNTLIDRLLHHCHIVNIRGNSYRMREHQQWLQSAADKRREGVAG